MKFVITGALGHIGSRLVRELPLLLPDIDIVMIDDLSTQRYCSLFNLPTQTTYTFIQGDLLKLDLSGSDIIGELSNNNISRITENVLKKFSI